MATEDETRLHIISRKKLLEAGEKYGERVAVQLDSWYRTAKSVVWKNLEEVRQTYPQADSVPIGQGKEKKVYTVFNIGGNNFRLITEVFYGDKTVLIRYVLTHAEYGKGDWKK